MRDEESSDEVIILNPQPQRQPQPPPRPAATDLQMHIAGWDVATLDAFYGLIDLPEPRLAADDKEAHWFWRGRLWCEGRPLCRIVLDDTPRRRSTAGPERDTEEKTEEEDEDEEEDNSLIVSVQRIIWLQFYGQDALSLRYLLTLCGERGCCNPKHLVCTK